MNIKEAEVILEKMRQEHIRRKPDFQEYNLVDGNYVAHHISRMYREFGGVWDSKRAQEYLRSLSADENMRKFDNLTPQDT